MKFAFVLTFLCCIVPCISKKTKYEEMCYTLLYCDAGRGKDSKFLEQAFSKPVKSSDITYSGCTKRRIQLDADGWKNRLTGTNFRAKFETYKHLKRVEQWIFRCDDNENDKKGGVKVGDKSCATNINALFFQVCWDMKKESSS